MSADLRFRWLGTAGIELEFRGDRILIDPYLSRFPLRFTFGGRPAPRRDLIARYLRQAEAVLISHSHFDHLADVPAVCGAFGASAFGSPNTCAILSAHRIPAEKIRTIAAGDRFSIGLFEITALPGEHGRLLGVLPYAGRLPAHLTPPLRLSDFRMDTMLSFHVRTPEISALIWNGPSSRGVPQADVLFYCPLWGARRCAAVVRAAQAGWVVPIHWDDFFSPLDRPLRPLVAPPGWNSLRIRRLDPEEFARSVNRLLPKVTVAVPQIQNPLHIE
jgi:L-ascorbate metabolism protein UlaG (beta-lactamase superfamily)